MQKIIFLIVAYICIGLTGCSKSKELNNETNSEKAVLEEHNSDKTGNEHIVVSSDGWENAYKKVICDIEENLPDPYHFNSEFGCFNGYVYVGIHDFDNDDIPELIIGDASSVAVFTYGQEKVEKVADLYETEEWGGINYLYYKENCIILKSCGNGGRDYTSGNGYVCFTYAQGKYITGFHCDYHPDETMINGKQVSVEEFQHQFNVVKLMENSNIAYSRVNEENEIILANSDEWVSINDLDFSLLEW